MTPTQWADNAFFRFSRYGQVGKLFDESDWQTWASELCSIAAIRNLAPPDPYNFDDFEMWADAFDQVIEIGD